MSSERAYTTYSSIGTVEVATTLMIFSPRRNDGKLLAIRCEGGDENWRAKNRTTTSCRLGLTLQISNFTSVLIAYLDFTSHVSNLLSCTHHVMIAAVSIDKAKRVNVSCGNTGARWKSIMMIPKPFDEHGLTMSWDNSLVPSFSELAVSSCR